MALRLEIALLLLAEIALQVDARDKCPAYGEIANNAPVASFSMDRFVGNWSEIESTRIPCACLFERANVQTNTRVL